MNPLLVSGFGTSINVDRRRLIITNKVENMRLEVYPHQAQFSSIVLDGHYGAISFEALRWLLKNDISLITLNWNGNLLSVTLPKETASANLRVKQYEKQLDNAFRFRVARSILEEKIQKSLDLLLKLSDYYPVLDKNSIADAFDATRLAFSNRPELLTYEGNVAIVYWQEMGKIFAQLAPKFNFTNRNGRRHSWNMNASDEVNALLNYGYALLEAQVRKTINSVGLDSTIGFLHELKDGRDSLVYDLMEPFRVLIDLSVVQLLEDKKLRKSDFIVTENYNIRLRESAAKALIEKVKVNFNMKAKYKGKNNSYENILLDNVRSLANHIEDKTSTFTLNIPDLELNRVDDADLRGRIMSMTIEERKRLGIKRNTLWYMKKSIAEGRKIKIYEKVMAKIYRSSHL
jgi:CRISPR-associated protein Cas1